ncbi:ABC transporter permease subunit [Microlunatus sp. GCM10028923]|uniref:ABC transporter permease subunit n=1 Tax=Microlunatus sp. GCM10028923 TaxID=3273400 RepID=UPI00362128AB
MSSRKSDRLRGRGLSLTLPSLILLVVVFLASMETIGEFSFHEFVPNGDNIVGSLHSWRNFLTDPATWRVVGETLAVATTVTLVLAVVGYLTAYALFSIRRTVGRNLGLFIVFSSLMFSGIASVYAWQLLLGRAGMINSALGVLGLGPFDLLYSRIAVVIALVHTLLPIMVFPIFNTLGQIDGALTEVADDLGASRWRTFSRVTLPLSAPGLLAGCQLVFAISISAFAAPALLGGGRVQVLSTTVYSLVNVSNFPVASVASLVLLIVALLSVGVFGLIQRRLPRSDSGGVTATPPKPAGVRLLGGWLGLVYVFQLITAFIVIVSSFSSVSYGQWPPPGFSLRWYTNLAEQDGVLAATASSLIVAAAVTVLAVVIGIMAAVGLTRHRLPAGPLINAAILSPTVVPKVAFGFAVFMLVYRLGLEPGRVALVLTHLVACIPFVVVIVSAGLLRADRTVEDAAVDLGAHRVRAFLSTTLPQIRPSVAVGALFAFLVSFNELDLSLFLLNADTKTLPVWMFNYLNNYQDPTPAALSTIMGLTSVVVALVAVPFVVRRGRGTAPAGQALGLPGGR